MKFSICIHNYNYEKYVGRTVRSALAQTYDNLEVLISDNASTDRSVEVIKEASDGRVRLSVNNCNVGFAGNLDRAARLATGERMIMLSSDDLMRPDALAAYRDLYDALGEKGESALATAAWDVIDADDRVTGRTGPDSVIWKASDRVPELEKVLGCPVYGVKGDELLKRCLLTMKGPFNFAATVYPRRMYQAVEGYGGGRLYNPDKWFHWRLLGIADTAYFVDRPLFAYRWHSNNQVSQESGMSALKYLVDEYVSTLELDGGLLARLGLSRDKVIDAFIEHDIANHGLATLARGHRERGRRILDFGRATYPRHLRRNRKAWALAALLALGPIGQRLAQTAYRRRNEKLGQAGGGSMLQLM
jgi:glycosyltransferase involved in cell wall biosynthesis